MQEIFKERVIELEKNLAHLAASMKKDSAPVIKARYRFTLETYLLNIRLLSEYEFHSPRYK